MSYTQTELIERNLEAVMNERDFVRRRKAIESIYEKDSAFFEENVSVSGYDAINQLVDGIQNKMPADFVFKMIKPSTTNHNLGRLAWSVGPIEGPDAATGMDIVLFKDDRIQSLYVFLDKPNERE